MPTRQLPQELIQAIILAGPTVQLSDDDLVGLSAYEWLKHLGSYTIPLLYASTVTHKLAVQYLYSDVILISHPEAMVKFLRNIQDPVKADWVKRVILQMPVRCPDYRYELESRILDSQRWLGNVRQLLAACPNLAVLVSGGGALEIGTFPTTISLSNLRFLGLGNEDFEIMTHFLSRATSLEHLVWAYPGGSSSTLMLTDPENLRAGSMDRVAAPIFRLKSLKVGAVGLNFDQVEWLLDFSVTSLETLDINPPKTTEEDTGITDDFLSYFEVQMASLKTEGLSWNLNTLNYHVENRPFPKVIESLTLQHISCFLTEGLLREVVDCVERRKLAASILITMARRRSRYGDIVQSMGDVDNCVSLIYRLPDLLKKTHTTPTILLCNAIDDDTCRFMLDRRNADALPHASSGKLKVSTWLNGQ